MTRWKALPSALDPRTRQLVVRLRELKDHSGLSGSALASRTGYSRSSWDRYLNGRTLPPVGAIEALAGVCGEDPARLLALRDVAQGARSAAEAEEGSASDGTGAAPGTTEPAQSPGGDTVVLNSRAGAAGSPDAPGTEDGGAEPAADSGETGPYTEPSAHPGAGTAAQARTGPAPGPGGDRAESPASPAPAGKRGNGRAAQPIPWLAIALTSVTTSAVMLVGLALIAPWDKGSSHDDARPGPSAPENKPYTGPVHPELGEFVYEPGKEYECAVSKDEDDGLMYSGYSRTRQELIEKDASRWSVVEAQCLVTYHGMAPGPADGAFGNNTERSVKRLQERAKIAVDGKVGPDTWKVLRSER
ncbi:helix-turn-helix domain-containing protein [Streptomyces sp. P38-E01]|uniref:Helix-turn-helix domain-containing protein n=1 Tax=Streptomyces tardus TaxID=2780544 RepID=A0A949N7K8_9ACTN|nr:helix-turn-helix domain-containing protein [Streptomyces tardus]MBU7597546.1 helix-turn-helix domain-containing protein [Streptomyces tardus]